MHSVWCVMSNISTWNSATCVMVLSFLKTVYQLLRVVDNDNLVEMQQDDDIPSLTRRLTTFSCFFLFTTPLDTVLKSPVVPEMIIIMVYIMLKLEIHGNSSRWIWYLPSLVFPSFISCFCPSSESLWMEVLSISKWSIMASANLTVTNSPTVWSKRMIFCGACEFLAVKVMTTSSSRSYDIWQWRHHTNLPDVHSTELGLNSL